MSTESSAPRAAAESVDLGALVEALRPELGSSLKVEQLIPISVGASNRMYQAVTSAGPLILRVPPRHKTSPTAHDMGREFRVLRALDSTAVPHPRALALCSDPEPFGVGFLVMEFVDGFNLKIGLDAPYAPAVEERREFALAAVATLADLASTDWQAAGLGDYGRPAGFLERQVNRWGSQLDAYRVRDLGGLDELAQWLKDSRPPAAPPAIMHGDFTFMNVMFAKGRPARVAALVDWEQSTIGDPLMDLGWFVGLWAHADEVSAAAPPGGRWVTQLGGMPTRAEVVRHYAERSGRDVSAIGYYQALALFKLVVVLEGNYAKYVRGASRNAHHADFEWMVPRLIDTARSAARGER
ncbi:phosphotransferase family protein [Streptomyces sp. UG1]|uniref:phosphotransferase family protein n=1 Tax=Streptomyces sp. UG1 TaxID=3417652 RepID=UPI003CF76CDE